MSNAMTESEQERAVKVEEAARAAYSEWMSDSDVGVAIAAMKRLGVVLGMADPGAPEIVEIEPGADGVRQFVVLPAVPPTAP